MNTTTKTKTARPARYYTVKDNNAGTASAWTLGWVTREFTTEQEARAAKGKGEMLIKSVYKLAPGRDLYVKDTYYSLVDPLS